MQEAVLERVEEYFMRRHNTTAQYIVTRTIMGLCEEAAMRPGTQLSKSWWEQDFLYL